MHQAFFTLKNEIHGVDRIERSVKTYEHQYGHSNLLVSGEGGPVA